VELRVCHSISGSRLNHENTEKSLAVISQDLSTSSAGSFSGLSPTRLHELSFVFSIMHPPGIAFE
jgi:hypothetical protein